MGKDQVQHGLGLCGGVESGEAVAQHAAAHGVHRLRQLTTPLPRDPGTPRRPLHIQPKALSLERIRRQLHPATTSDPATNTPEHTGPLNRHPTHEQLGHGHQEASQAAFAPAQRSDDQAVQVTHLVQGFLHTDRDGRMRARLDEDGVAGADQRLCRVPEADDLAQVAVPVVGVEFGAVDAFAGDGGVEGHVAGPRADGGEEFEQPPLDRLDLRGVRRPVDHEPAGRYVFV
ncbi:hypothetical protein Save01_09184 [Streptomyces avermitilis]